MRYPVLIALLFSVLVLAGCGGGKANKYIEDLNSSNPEVVSKAVFYIGKRGGPNAVGGLVKVLNGGMPASVKIEAIEALGKIGHASAVEPLVDMLSSDVDGIRTASCESLGRIGDSKAVMPLVNVLENKESRITALWALGKIGDSRAEPALKALLESDDKYVQYGAVKALRALGDKE